MRNEWIQLLHFPKKTVLNRHLPKKLFVEQRNFSPADKTIFSATVENIYLLSVMNQQTTNIAAIQNEDIHYAEINWLYVKLRSQQHWQKVNSLLHKTLPNPIVCIFESSEQQFCITAAHKRLNKQDTTKIIVEDIQQTPWMTWSQLNEQKAFTQSLQFEQLPKKDWLHVYNAIHDTIKRSQSIQLVGQFIQNSNLQQTIDTLLQQIEQTTKIIQQLEAQQKTTIDFGDKMQIHMQITHHQQQINHLKTQLQNLQQ